MNGIDIKVKDLQTLKLILPSIGGDLYHELMPRLKPCVKNSSGLRNCHCHLAKGSIIISIN